MASLQNLSNTEGEARGMNYTWKTSALHLHDLCDRDLAEARAVAIRLYRRVQELERERDWRDGIEAVRESYDITALVDALAHILAHNRVRRGWSLSGLSPELRARVEQAAKDEWDAFVAKRG